MGGGWALNGGINSTKAGSIYTTIWIRPVSFNVKEKLENFDNKSSEEKIALAGCKVLAESIADLKALLQEREEQRKKWWGDYEKIKNILVTKFYNNENFNVKVWVSGLNRWFAKSLN